MKIKYHLFIFSKILGFNLIKRILFSASDDKFWRFGVKTKGSEVKALSTETWETETAKPISANFPKTSFSYDFSF